ncbi:DUF1822 family protein [Oscillatoria sp. FACHB-1406]|uniref:DUF1822 family protein n=1 Tax=Oscillatoria sp. FACHB-1406 TaxID=2692846 RepID=UPI00168322A2|nr:DUF1822 family protein [Oscillatoria sp. FACHB-1406]MBD2579917.1 DUF1822 family protein [Oscillatoria sp. FACHB-1406]
MTPNELHNLVLKFEGSKEDYERLLACFQSGELESLLQLPVEEVRLVSAPSETTAPTTAIAQSLETVPQILQRIYNSLESGWQSIEALLAPESPTLAAGWRSAPPLPTQVLELKEARSSLTPSEGFMRWINLDLPEINRQIILIVALMPGESPQEIDALIEVRPTQEQAFLPPDLQLMVIDYRGSVVLSARAEKADPRISFALTGTVGEPFEVKVKLNDFSYLQEFPL